MDRKMGTCPACNGTKRVPAGDNPHKACVSGYDKSTDTNECRNCGYQYMCSTAKGVVPLRPDGTPCLHEYESWDAGRCLTGHICKHCGDRYDIDSSD
jgi:hypothetical protein